MPEEKCIEDIAKIVGAIQPRYAENRREVIKKLRDGISAASSIVKPDPVWEHNIVYDSSAEQLEPIYFWIIDFMSDLGFKNEKIVDNFAASPGSGYFAEIGGRATKMQEEGMKIMATVNTVIRSLINLLYDLKEFEIRLKHYDMANSKDPKEREPGILGLKQIWMDKVDMQRGRGSINLMSVEVGFTTLRDAFMVAKSIEDVDKIDLNDRVKRILKPRVAEFLEWKQRSEAELRKRFEIERSYLKSQVGNLKLYTRWARPYFKAAEQLMATEKGREPALVKAFNTILLELCILGKQQINLKDEVDAGNLPRAFRTRKLKREYYACVFVDFTFRGIPSRTPRGHYVFGGRADVSFKAFVLNDDELKALDKELTKTDFQDAIKMVEAVTEESIGEIASDIEHFLGKGEKGEKIEKGKPEDKKKEKIRADSYEESVIRSFSEQRAAELCYKVYDIYKKAHNMASFVEPEWEYPPKWKVPE